MPFGSPNTPSEFDGTNKGDWFFADMFGMFHTWWVMLVFILAIMWILEILTGISLLTHVSSIYNLIKERLGPDWAFTVMFFITVIPPFILVFVLRRNFFVIGARRQFGYFSRWP